MYYILSPIEKSIFLKYPPRICMRKISKISKDLKADKEQMAERNGIIK